MGWDGRKGKEESLQSRCFSTTMTLSLMCPGIKAITFHMDITFVSSEFTACTLPVPLYAVEATSNAR